LAAAMGFNSNSLMSAAGGIDTGNYVTNLNETNIRNTLAGYTANFLNTLQSNYPNASVEDILSGQYIVPYTQSNYIFFATYSFGGSTNEIWQNIPTNYMASMSVKFAGTNYSWFTPQLKGQRLSLTFDNSGLAQLWQDDALLAQHTTSGTSGITNVVVSVNHPYGTWSFTSNAFFDGIFKDQVSTNAYQRTNSTYAIIYAFDPDWSWLQERQDMLDSYRQQGLSDTSRQVVSETLNIMGMNWMLQTEWTEKMLATQMGISHLFDHRIGRMAQEAGGGYYVDVYMQFAGDFSSTGSDAANDAKESRDFDLSGYFESAFEHGIIEQLQNSNLVAASTVKMLQIANANGQPIYMASSTNWTAGANVKNSLVNYPNVTTLTAFVNAGYKLLLPKNGSNQVAGPGSWGGFACEAWYMTSSNQDQRMLINSTYHGGIAADQNATVDAPFVSIFGAAQAQSFTEAALLTPYLTGADPVDMVDDTFQVEHTDLSLGQSEPRGITLSRYYNGTRRYSNPAGMAGGWLHNYCIHAYNVAAPQAGLGMTTPAQAAPMIVATCAAIGIYNNAQPDPKNWVVSVLIAKWGIDQIIRNGVSVTLGKDTVQFVQQPDGSFTPPGNCTMTLSQNGSTYSLHQRHGNTFNFDSNGRLSTIVDPYNNSLSLTYTNNLVKSVSDWKGRSMTFNYTGARLTSVADNNGRSISYGYNAQGDLVSYTDPEGKICTYLYDTNHQITAAFDASSRLVVSNIYDSMGHLALQYTQGDTNKAWQIFWSKWLNIEQNPAGSTRYLYYDDKGRLYKSYDQLNNRTLTFYDGQNHIVQTVSPMNETNQFIYDGNNNLVQTIDTLGFTNQFFYDSQNNLVRSVDPRGNPTTYGYNAQFSLTGQTNGAGDWVNYTYNTDGTLHARADAGGATTYDTYDSWGLVSHITYPGSFGGESFVNNSLGDVTSHTDARGFITAFAYNNRRQLTNSVAPTNLTVKVSFDAIGNEASTTDARGNSVSNSWSATRQLLATTFPSTPQGVPVATNSYDNCDWLVRSVNPLQQPKLYTNDAAGRLISVTDPLLRTTLFGYDANGRKLTTVNAANETNSQTWDARGNLVKLTDGAGHYSLRNYDATGNQIALTNRNGKKWQFQFDAANRLTNTITPLGRSSSATFNNRGLVSTTKDAANQPTSLYYDAKGRLTNRTDNVGTTFYSFDANGNRTSLSENGLTNTWTYDAYNRVSTYKDVYGNLIQYRYDANGNLTNLIYPGGKNVFYSYDALNRMTNVTDWSNRKTSISYDLANRITSIVRPNGSYRTIQYDVAGQATNIMEQMGNTLPIAIFKHDWNASGTMKWEFTAPLAHSTTVPTRTMTYDDDNRVTTVNGNSVTMDDNGNLTSGPLIDNAFADYAYDARNRLLNVGGVTNVYDGMDNRIGQMLGTNTTVYVVNPNTKQTQVLMRIKNGVTNYYVYGAGLLYQITETASATNTLTYHYDYRGSTIALSSDSGIVTDRIEYSAYGLTTYRAGLTDTPFLFNGRYGVQTDSNGLLYMQSRYYNPYLCRFISIDPSGFSGGLNFYAFAMGNPVSLVDPFGLSAQSTGDSSWSWMGIYNTVANSVVPGQASWNNAQANYNAGNYGYAALNTVSMVSEQVLFVLTLGASSGTTTTINNSSRLVHLTDSASGAEINASQVLRGNNYAGPLANANASGAGVTLRTGMSGFDAAVPIPAAAEGAFSQVTPIGPITLWQRVMGQQYTANGVLDLTTGVFMRAGVNWNQAAIYGIDATITGGSVAAGTYLFSNP
jgi:RHS repeat-associated protein